jgi:hypothetical protein
VAVAVAFLALVAVAVAVATGAAATGAAALPLVAGAGVATTGVAVAVAADLVTFLEAEAEELIILAEEEEEEDILRGTYTYSRAENHFFPQTNTGRLSISHCVRFYFEVMTCACRINSFYCFLYKSIRANKTIRSGGRWRVPASVSNLRSTLTSGVLLRLHMATSALDIRNPRFFGLLLP